MASDLETGLDIFIGVILLAVGVLVVRRVPDELRSLREEPVKTIIVWIGCVVVLWVSGFIGLLDRWLMRTFGS